MIDSIIHKVWVNSALIIEGFVALACTLIMFMVLVAVIIILGNIVVFLVDKLWDLKRERKRRQEERK